MRKIFTRPVVVIIALLLQMGWLFVHAFYLSSHYAAVSFFVYLISVIAILWIINREDSAEFKLPWVILILTAPIIGGILYFLTSSEGVFKKQRQRYCTAEGKMNAVDTATPEMDCADMDTAYIGQVRCAAAQGFPVYQHTQTKFYPLADQAFPDMLVAFRAAKRYIYLEYFILTPGEMWNTILDILADKV